MVYNWLKNTLSRWLPDSACVLCGQSTGSAHSLCTPCNNDLPWLERCSPLCSRCLQPQASDHCQHCQQHPPVADQLHAAFAYQFPVDRLIPAFKFHHQLAAGRALAEAWATRLAARAEPLPQLLLPVPLHQQRLQERGFNQAEKLARALGQALHIPVAHDLLLHPHATASLHKLDRVDRSRAIRRAFALNAGQQHRLRGAHVALVDDVITTGATSDALASLLRQAGVDHIEVWALARTLKAQARPAGRPTATDANPLRHVQ